MNRRQFLCGRETQLRPPWSVNESRFRDICTRCGDCISACKEQVIVEGRGGFPTINFNKGECVFCGDCVQQCESGSLDKEKFEKNGLPWLLKASITADCLNHSGIVCRSCGDSCAEQVIRYRPEVGGRLTVELDYPTCTGCGACFSTCPTHAVKMMPIKDMIVEPKTPLENCA